MIKPKFIALLVGAKLRARPGRSAIIVGVSSILFGIGFAGLTVVNAGLESAQRFSDAKYRGRQYVQADYSRDAGELTANETVQQKAKAIYNADIAQKKVEAKKLGIDFDPRTIVDPVEQIPGANKGDMMLNLAAPSAIQAVAEYEKEHPGVGIQNLEAIAKQYSALSVIPMKGLNAKEGTVSLMKDGRETYVSVDTSSDFIAQAPLRLVDESAIKPFINKSVKISKGEIPIVLPYAAAETVLGVNRLNRSASADQKLERLKYLQDNAIKKSFAVCYRNTISKGQIDQAANGADKNSVESALVTYVLPADDTCAAPKVKQDKRTSEERALDAKRHIFNVKFGIQDAPAQQKLDFQIVGLVPDDLWSASSAQSDPIETARLLLGPALLGQATVTTQGFETISSELKSLLEQGQASKMPYVDTYLVEFANVSDAGRFIQEKSCDRIEGGACGRGDRLFQLSAFGSGGVVLANLKNTTSRAASYVIGVIIIVAVLVMAGTFGRIIGDERRETAVFRAVGASRTDITLIYIVYALTLALVASAVAVLIGLILTCVLNGFLAHDLTVALRLTYGVLDESIYLTLFKIDILSALLITGTIVATGLISVALPLQRSIGRNVILDLKD